MASDTTAASGAASHPFAWASDGGSITFDEHTAKQRGYRPLVFADDLPSAPAAQEAEPAPIDMVLHCPACGMQHIDAPETLPMAYAIGAAHFSPGYEPWENPPHRSHLCHGCSHIWRPADVPTNGVAAVQTKGKADSPIAAHPPRPQADAGAVAVPEGWRLVREEKLRNAHRQASLAVNQIVGFAKAKPGGMCGWLDDACTAAEIAEKDLQQMLSAAAPQAPAAADMESVLIDGVAYQTPAPVAAELLRLHLEAMQAPAAGAAPTLDAADLAILSAGAKSGDPGALALAAQLAGVPACSRCGYVKHHCRCAAPAQGGGAA